MCLLYYVDNSWKDGEDDDDKNDGEDVFFGIWNGATEEISGADECACPE